MSDLALVLRESVLEIAGNERTILKAIERRHKVVIRPRPHLYPLGATRSGMPGATNVDIAGGRLVV